MIEDPPCHFYPSLPRHFNRKKGMIYRSQTGSGNDEDRQLQIEGQISHHFFPSDRYEKSSGSFNEKGLMFFQKSSVGPFNLFKKDRNFFDLCGCKRG